MIAPLNSYPIVKWTAYHNRVQNWILHKLSTHKTLSLRKTYFSIIQIFTRNSFPVVRMLTSSFSGKPHKQFECPMCCIMNKMWNICLLIQLKTSASTWFGFCFCNFFRNIQVFQIALCVLKVSFQIIVQLQFYLKRNSTVFILTRNKAAN